MADWWGENCHLLAQIVLRPHHKDTELRQSVQNWVIGRTLAPCKSVQFNFIISAAVLRRLQMFIREHMWTNIMKTKGYSRRAGIKVVEKLAQNTSCVSSAWSKMVDGAKCMVTIEEIYRQKQKTPKWFRIKSKYNWELGTNVKIHINRCFLSNLTELDVQSQ